MSELLNGRELSRRTFLKGGAAVAAGLSVAGAAQAADDPKAASPAHTGAVPGPPDPAQIDSWLQVEPDNTVTVYAGWSELGQGTPTAVVQIVAEELDLRVDQVRYAQVDTNSSMSAYTAGSGSTRGALGTNGNALRPAAAAARKVLLARAAEQLGVPASSLSVSEGVVSGGGKSVTYGELLGGKVFGSTIAAQKAKPKEISELRVIGTRVPRIDIPAIVTGKLTYAHNVRVPGMLHGRVVRPRGQTALSLGKNEVLSVNERSIANIKSAKVIRFGNFVGVVAPNEWDAIQAAAQLEVKWAPTTGLPSSGNLEQALRDPKNLLSEAVTLSKGNVGTGIAKADKVIERRFFVPYQMHASMGPHAAVADVKPGKAVVLGHAQGAYSTRSLIFNALRTVDPAHFTDQESVRFMFFPASGVYGHANYDDANVAAALLSLGAGKPVRVQLMRWDEHGWDQFGTAQAFDMRAGIDANGKIVAYDATNYLHGWTQVVENSAELAGQPLPDSPRTRNADTDGLGEAYALPNRRILTKRVDGYKGFLKSTYLRAPEAPQAVFASESLIDDLAHAAQMDPVAFRKLNLRGDEDGQRWAAVIDRVAKLAGWRPKVAASNLASGDVVKGRGIAIGGFAGAFPAIVADITVNKKTGKITVDHLYAAQENGLGANPASIENQMVGCLVHGCSRALYEQVRFTQSRQTSLDWVSYPVLRFKDSPKVTVAHIQRTDLPPAGSGEPATVAVPAAIGNAFFDATGVRLTRFPFTPAYVRASLAAAAKKA